MSLDLRIPYLGKRVADALAVARFCIVLQAGGQLEITWPDGRPLGFTNMALPNLRPLDQLKATEAMLQRLSFVQSKALGLGPFDLSRGLSKDDLRAIDDLYSFYTKGKWEVTGGTFTFHLNQAPALPPDPTGDDRSFTMEWPDLEIELLSLRIPVGRIRAAFKNGASVAEAFRQAALNGSTTIEIDDDLVFRRVQEPLLPSLDPEAGR
jgi:hypothetical protein